MRSAIEQQIRSEALTDSVFRAALLADAPGAIAERYGVTIPNGISIRVIEESAGEVVLALPATGSSLSDADLDAHRVAGGTFDVTADGSY